LTNLEILGRRGDVFVSTSENTNQIAEEPEEDGWVESKEKIQAIEGQVAKFRDSAARKGINVSGQAVEGMEIFQKLVDEDEKRYQHNLRCFENRRTGKEESTAERVLGLTGGN